MSKGLIISQAETTPEEVTYVLSEYDTDTDEHQELAESVDDMGPLLDEAYRIENSSKYDAELIVDLTTPTQEVH